MEKIWLKQYPASVPAQVRTDLYPCLVALLEDSFRKHRDLAACKCMGSSIRYGQNHRVGADVCAAKTIWHSRNQRNRGTTTHRAVIVTAIIYIGNNKCKMICLSRNYRN